MSEPARICCYVCHKPVDTVYGMLWREQGLTMPMVPVHTTCERRLLAATEHSQLAQELQPDE